MTQLPDAHLDELNRQLAVQDVLAGGRMDDLTEVLLLVHRSLGYPVVAVNLITRSTQTTICAHGFEPTSIPRDQSICTWTIADTGELFEVPDATQDARFRTNPWVRMPSGIRAYAGVVLESLDGLPLGTLCVADWVPRTLSPEARASLRTYAKLVEDRLMRRRASKLASAFVHHLREGSGVSLPHSLSESVAALGFGLDVLLRFREESASQLAEGSRSRESPGPAEPGFADACESQLRAVRKQLDQHARRGAANRQRVTIRELVRPIFEVCSRHPSNTKLTLVGEGTGTVDVALSALQTTLLRMVLHLMDSPGIERISLGVHKLEERDVVSVQVQPPIEESWWRRSDVTQSAVDVAIAHGGEVDLDVRGGTLRILLPVR